jgi:hypothetical protein
MPPERVIKHNNARVSIEQEMDWLVIALFLQGECQLGKVAENLS